MPLNSILFMNSMASVVLGSTSSVRSLARSGDRRGQSKGEKHRAPGPEAVRDATFYVSVPDSVFPLLFPSEKEGRPE